MKKLTVVLVAIALLALATAATAHNHQVRVAQAQTEYHKCLEWKWGRRPEPDVIWAALCWQEYQQALQE